SQAVEQVVRVERDTWLRAVEFGWHGFHGAGPALGLCFDHDFAGAEAEPDRARPVRDQGDPADGLGERPAGHVRAAAELAGESWPVADEFPADQPGGQPPAGAPATAQA